MDFPFKPIFWPNSPNLPYFRPIFTSCFQIFGATRALFRGGRNSKVEIGGGEILEEFELYLPVIPSAKFQGHRAFFHVIKVG